MKSFCTKFIRPVHLSALLLVAVGVAFGPASSAIAAPASDAALTQRPRLSGLPAQLVKTQTVKLTFGGKKGYGYQCRLDANPWHACKSPYLFRGSKLDARQGYYFALRQISKRGASPELVRSFSVTPSARITWKSLEAGEFGLGLDLPYDCTKGKLVFDLWGSSGRIHFSGDGHCGYSSRRLSTGGGVEGRITSGGITLTIKGNKRYTDTQRFKWRVTFAGGTIGSGKVLFTRSYSPGRPNRRVYSDTEWSLYWSDRCLYPNLDSNIRAYCILPGYPSTWDTSVGRW